MAITARTATVVENASTSSITASLPTDRQAGDCVVAAFVLSCTLAQFTGPGAGWTQAFAPFFSNDNNVVATYYAFSPASAPTCSASVAGRASVITQAYGGVNASTPLDVTSATATTSPYGTSLAVGGVTTVTNGAMLISGCVVDSSTQLLDTPSGMTTVGDACGGGVGRGLKVAQEARATAGGTGSRTWQTNPSNTLGLGAWMMALRPSNSLTLTGSSTPTGTLAKSVTKTFTGASTATGVLIALKVVAKVFTGSATATGALAKKVAKTLTGTSTGTGVLTKRMPKVFTGTSTPSGVYGKAFVRLFTGTVTPVGTFTVTLLGRVFGRPGIVTAVVQRAGEVITRFRHT